MYSKICTDVFVQETQHLKQSRYITPSNLQYENGYDQDEPNILIGQNRPDYLVIPF